MSWRNWKWEKLSKERKKNYERWKEKVIKEREGWRERSRNNNWDRRFRNVSKNGRKKDEKKFNRKV